MSLMCTETPDALTGRASVRVRVAGLVGEHQAVRDRLRRPDGGFADLDAVAVAVQGVDVFLV
jgi:hypothetical protein